MSGVLELTARRIQDRRDRLKELILLKGVNTVSYIETAKPGMSLATVQAQITALIAAGGGTLIFEPGAYSFAGTLTINTATNLSIHGIGATITQTTAETKTIYVLNSANVSITNLFFVGKGTEDPWAGSSYNGACAILIEDSTNCSVKDCICTNHTGGSIRYRGTVSGLRITGNVVAGMGSPTIQTADNGSDFGIANAGGDATADGMVISGNIVSDHAFGIASSLGDGITISNNIVRNIAGQHAIYCGPGGRLAITGNVITAIAYAGIKCQIGSAQLDVTDEVTVSNNIIEDCGQSGIIFNDASSGDNKGFYNVVISGNNINNVQEGIYPYHCYRAMISNNRVYDCSSFGIYFAKSSGNIHNNVFRKCENAGIYNYIPQGPVSIQGNDVIDSPVNTAGATAEKSRSCIYIDDNDSTAYTTYIDGGAIWYEEASEPSGAGALQFAISSHGPNGNVTLGRVANSTSVGLFVDATLTDSALVSYQLPPATIADGDTPMTVADLLTRLLSMNSTAARAPTVPTGTAVYAQIGIREAIEWTFINSGNSVVTITVAAGHTFFAGSTMTIAAGASATFRTRCSTVNTAVTYRLT